MKQRELNRKTEDILNRIEYSLSNKDYDGLIVELQNYQTIQQGGMNTLNEEYISSILNPILINAMDYQTPQSITLTKSWDDALRNIGRDVPEKQKQAIDIGMSIAGVFANDANKFWKVATGDVKGYQEYVEQNGIFVESISQLPFDIKNTVRTKVKE